MPLFDRPIAAFDIETIPDPEIGRRVLGLEGEDVEVVHRMVELRLEETDGHTGYPQLPYHRVVTVGVAWLDPGSGMGPANGAAKFKLGTVGGEAMDERSHLEGFFALLRGTELRAGPANGTASGTANRPTRLAPRLVSWNGSGFDLPVIRYRAVKHGIPAPELYRDTDEWRWENYQNRYHSMHVDLMDVLSGYRASPFAGLGRLCDLLEIPSKKFLEGEIYDQVLAGERRIVEEYCKLDCLDTLLVFLAWAVHVGELEDGRLREWVALMREALAEEADPRWAELAGQLEGWPRWGEAG